MTDSASIMPASPLSGLDWLYGSQMFGMKLGLETIRRLLQEMDLPAPEQRFIHVAGTNGKGSTCAFMHAILKEAGINCGLFTSPHLIRFNERIRDAERLISDDEIEAGLGRIRRLVAGWEPHPTFFELTLALALEWFRERRSKWIVLETGLGGRMDATNIVTPEVSVITRIGMDHVQQLGPTLAAIAGEKAGIIKPGIPVVTGPQEPEAMAVIEEIARRQGAELTVVERPLTAVTLPLAGDHQTWNAAVAVAALRQARLDVSENVVTRGLSRTDWPARFQRMDGGRIIVDGAHNEDAARALAAAWQQVFPGEKAVIIFGGSSGKDLSATLRALAPVARRFVFTAFSSPRAVPVAELRRAWEAVDYPATIPVATAGSLAEAQAGAGPAERLLVTGSLFLAGEFLAQRCEQRGEYQPSTQ